jgi:hypothetical protein
MLESGSSGSVRGASSNGRPYREPFAMPALRVRHEKMALFGEWQAPPGNRSGLATAGAVMEVKKWLTPSVLVTNR